MEESLLLFKIVEIPGKGSGMVATQKIQRGQLIIAEKPLFVIRPRTNNREVLRRQMEQEASNLTDKNKKLFYALYDHKSPSSPTVVGIFKTNALPLGVDSPDGGLFPTIARVNHSCRPNANHVWDEAKGMETVHALKEIAPDEEILTTYCDLMRDTTTRQETLKKKFKFTCTCSLCSCSDPVQQKRSNIRRNVMKQLHERVPSVASLYPKQALDDLDSLFKLFEEEGMGDDAGIIGSASYDYFQILYQINPTASRKLKHWARMTIDNRTIANGKHNAVEDMRLKHQLLTHY